MPATRTRPVTIALVDDYDVVLKGLAHMFDDYRDRVLVAEIDANAALSDEIDIVLYDSFAQPESDHHEIAELVRNPRARRVVVYTWNFQPELVADARMQGVHGYLSKALPARELVEALERIHSGEAVQPGAAAGRERAVARLAGQARGDHGPRVGDPRAHHAGQEQPGGRGAHVPLPQHGEELHPLDLPQDPGAEPHPGGDLGCRARVQPGSPPDRPLAGWAVAGT